MLIGLESKDSRYTHNAGAVFSLNYHIVGVRNTDVKFSLEWKQGGEVTYLDRRPSPSCTVRPRSSLRHMTPAEFRKCGHRTGVSRHADRLYRPSVGKVGCAGTPEC
jgi:hypothetical protein